MGTASYDFTGETVLVTGAARGMGRDMALGFARAGAKVAVNDLAKPKAREGVPYETASGSDLDDTISSTSGLVGIPGQVNYQSSKHGLIGQVKVLALEMASYGVTVNAVCPTVIDTPMLDYLVSTGAAYWQDVSRLCGASTVFPGVEFLQPRDVTHAVQWLASDAARYVTGIALPVDGGFTCK